MNMIEDKGFTAILKAISSNRRSLVIDIDLSWNLITGLDTGLVTALKKYSNPVFGKCLNISLYNNHIRFHLDAGDEFRNDLLLLYELDSSANDLTSPSKHRNKNLKHRVERSMSVVDELHPVKPPPRQSSAGNKGKILFKSKPLTKRVTASELSLTQTAFL